MKKLKTFHCKHLTIFDETFTMIPITIYHQTVHIPLLAFNQSLAHTKFVCHKQLNNFSDQYLSPTWRTDAYTCYRNNFLIINITNICISHRDYHCFLQVTKVQLNSKLKAINYGVWTNQTNINTE